MGSFLSGLFNMINPNKQAALNRQAQANLQTNSIAAQEGANTQSVAANESQLDPFRQQVSQARDLMNVDKAANSSFSPVQVSSAGGPGAPFVRSGGYSYSKSPQLSGDLNAIESSIRAGNGAPSMTNPANYGKTSALNLVNVAAGKADPTSTSAFATGAPAAASTLGSDPVANQIRNAYQTYLGRQPSDTEIQNVIGQLGQIYNRPITASDSNLISGWIQNNLATSPEAQAYKGASASSSFGPSYASGT